MDSLHVTLVAATLITVAVLYLAVTTGQSTPKSGGRIASCSGSWRP